MFAGLAAFVLDAEETTITGMASGEAEVVSFRKTVSIKENAKINEWLTLVEEEMRSTLAILLQEAYTELSAMTFATDTYLQWIEKYPTQLVVLVAQVSGND